MIEKMPTTEQLKSALMICEREGLTSFRFHIDEPKLTPHNGLDLPSNKPLPTIELGVNEIREKLDVMERPCS